MTITKYFVIKQYVPRLDFMRNHILLFFVLKILIFQFIYYFYSSIQNKSAPTKLIENRLVTKHIDFGQNLLSKCSKIVEKYDIVFVTLINHAFLDFTSNWLCNTLNLTGVHNRTLIITTDEKSSDFLSLNWPKIATVLINTTKNERFSKLLYWGDKDYVSFMALR